MAAVKRRANVDASVSKKRAKFDDGKDENPVVSILRPEEVDFPRGGGTTLPPVEYKKVRAEALKELREEDVFKDLEEAGKRPKKDLKGKKPSKTKSSKGKTQEQTRVEHLNYKRIAPGMKILCQVFSIQPFAIIVSLPNQLFGHIPITQISTQLTERLEELNRDEDAEMEVDNDSDDERQEPPSLDDMFVPGQYLRAVVSSVKPAGTTDGGSSSHARDEIERASRRVELSLVPEQVNTGVSKSDLIKGMTLSAAVKSVEDHGYMLDCGIADITGFLPFKRDEGQERKITVGTVLNVAVTKLSDNGRACSFSADGKEVKNASLREITNVSSLLPGSLVSCLITTVLPTGLNVQVLGSLKGTIDLCHLSNADISSFKAGQKISARILYDVVGSSPAQYSLSLNEHIVSLDRKRRNSEDSRPIEEAFPIGTTIQISKVSRVEAEHGLFMSIEPGVEGFVHISHASDEHVPSLSSNSGPWKVDTVHQARVIGFHPLDGILQLSLRQSVLNQKFLRVEDVKVGELVKGTIKKLTDSALFVSINGNVDAVIRPLHYADIILRHPQKRFKPGAPLKCKVLGVDPERKRILLTAKKSLVESDLPIISSVEDAKPGSVGLAVVVKTLGNSVLVEFFNGIRAMIPGKEISETSFSKVEEAAPLGKVVKARILSVDNDTSRILASIRQANIAVKSTSSKKSLDGVEIGQVVRGKITAIHRDNVVLSLDPSEATALISLNNIANKRGVDVLEVRSSLKVGDTLEELVVVTRNPDKGIVIVASSPSIRGSDSLQPPLHMKDVSIGMKVKGRVSKHTRFGSLVKFSGHLVGMLHPTDVDDDYDKSSPFPPISSEVDAVVISIDRSKKSLGLSTRSSRMQPDSGSVVKDPEISELNDLKVGCVVRGFIKNITDHGLYVTLGRNVDARVQIREAHDEFVKDWKSGFRENQVVSGRIVKIDKATNQIEMSFRSESAVGSSKAEFVLDDLAVGQRVHGKVKKIETYGIFITINDTKLSGLCHKSEITDNEGADVDLALRNFKEGDDIKAVITGIDKEKRRISLSMKPSRFEGEGNEASDSEDEAASPSESSTPDAPIRVTDTLPEQETDGSDNEDEEDPIEFDNTEILRRTQPNTVARTSVHTSGSVPTLPLQGGFQWTANEEFLDDMSSGDDSEDEDGQATNKKSKRKKKTIQEDLTADMHTRLPQSNADFERHLLSSPDSSYLWIQYMSFQLQLSEIDKAREIGKRALKAINIREEQEKLNVWIALLNIENVYGTEDSLEIVFKDAARHNDSKTIHLRLAAILDQSDKSERAEEQYKRTSKKFGKSSKVWTLFGEHYFRLGKLEEARKLLPRSLLSLEKRKHLKTISKFAQLEYKMGDPERGKTIFEGIIDSHPRRFDLWSIYMDMEAGQKDIQNIRNLFERVLAIKMTSHKAKSFFKKWLNLERRIGDGEGEQKVKEKAIEWTQKAVST